MGLFPFQIIACARYAMVAVVDIGENGWVQLGAVRRIGSFAASLSRALLGLLASRGATS